MIVKICGITKPYETEYINEIRPDFAGIVRFFEKSRRNVDERVSRELVRLIDTKTVAVTVEPDAEQIKRIADEGFDYIQIHGNVSDELLLSSPLPVIKAFNVTDISDFERYEKCDRICGYIFDAHTPGSGIRLSPADVEKIPFSGKMRLLAGGLTPDNVSEALGLSGLDGADTSSGVEKDDHTGKDRDRIARFVANVKKVSL